MSIAWFAVDWGTTHLRAWGMDATGAIEVSLSSDDGMGALTPDQFEPALLRLLEPHLDASRTIPVICCGMVGARQGWIEAAYQAVPSAPPSALNATKPPVTDPRIDVFILPGMMQSKPADVMRGEETQIAGYLSQNPEYDGILCLPGTHTKWVHISAGEVVSFATFMTGEMFALLSAQSVLRHGISDGWDDAVFAQAISDAIARPQSFASSLFSLRAQGLLHGLSGDATRARLSGLLIGLELAGARPYWLGQQIVLIGDGTLAGHYQTALNAQCAPSVLANAETLTLAGLTAAYQSLTQGNSA